MLMTFHFAPNLVEAPREANLARRSPRPTALASWPSLTVLRKTCDALGEAVAAYRRYERLRSRGTPHDPAIRRALHIGLA